jgi:hypothetical protein
VTIKKEDNFLDIGFEVVVGVEVKDEIGIISG